MVTRQSFGFVHSSVPRLSTGWNRPGVDSEANPQPGAPFLGRGGLPGPEQFKLVGVRSGQVTGPFIMPHAGEAVRPEVPRHLKRNITSTEYAVVKHE